MSRIYLAARFSRRHECHALGQLLQSIGHEIVSRWTLPGEDHVIPAGSSEQAADDERRRFAMEDMEDVRACDWCISLMEEPRSNGRGGRHIEFGVALGLGKRLTIIGPRETVFHHLDEIEQFDTIEDFTASLEPVDSRRPFILDVDVTPGRRCTLAARPPGLFLFGDTLGFKTEYRAMEPIGYVAPGDGMCWSVGTHSEVYVVASGEAFWGGADGRDTREQLMVVPLGGSAKG